MVCHTVAKLNQSKDIGTTELPPVPLLLKRQCASESSGKLIKIQISGPPPSPVSGSIVWGMSRNLHF